MVRISMKKARELGLAKGKSKGVSKYHSTRVVVDDIKFDSQKEADKYCELKLLFRAGEIKKLELQPEYVLQEGFRGPNGKWIRPIKYIADFRITYPDGRIVVIDTKGYRTKEYRIKKKLFLKRYPEIKFVEE